MKDRPTLPALAIAAGALLLPHSAQAHHAEYMAGAPLLQGLSMPAHGLDHLLSALAVGMIAAHADKKFRFKFLLLFALIALVGGFTNLSGLSLPEFAVPLTVLVSGVMLWKNTNTLWLIALLAAIAGLANGQALILQAPLSLSSTLFAAGCLITAGGLSGIGLLLGHALSPSQTFSRIAGCSLVAGATLVTLFPNLNAALIRLVE